MDEDATASRVRGYAGEGRPLPGRLDPCDRIALVEDSRMHNILSLPAERRRPERRLSVPRNGARILFFTGVRYCRDEPAGDDVASAAFHVVQGSPSDRMFDVAAH